MGEETRKRIVDAANGRWLSNKTWFAIIAAAIGLTITAFNYLDTREEKSWNEISQLSMEIKSLRCDVKDMKVAVTRMETFLLKEYGFKYPNTAGADHIPDQIVNSTDYTKELAYAGFAPVRVIKLFYEHPACK